MTLAEAKKKLSEVGKIDNVTENGKQIPVHRVIIAATDKKIFLDYIRHIYENKSYEQAAILTGATDFDLLAVFKEFELQTFEYGWLDRYLVY